MGERTVIAAIRDRDPDAISRVIDRYSRLLWPIASAVLCNVGSEQDVEECVADAFVYLWEHPEKYDPARGSLKTFLCVVVRSRALDRCRELSRRGAVPLEEADLAAGMGLLERYLRQETRQELLETLQTLEEPTREILLRRYFYDQKPRQIALALGLSVKQVDNALYRGKRQLRKGLEERGGVL